MPGQVEGRRTQRRPVTRHSGLQQGPRQEESVVCTLPPLSLPRALRRTCCAGCIASAGEEAGGGDWGVGRARYNPYQQSCKGCKSPLHAGVGMFCHACAYKKGATTRVCWGLATGESWWAHTGGGKALAFKPPDATRWCHNS